MEPFNSCTLQRFSSAWCVCRSVFRSGKASYCRSSNSHDVVDAAPADMFGHMQYCEGHNERGSSEHLANCLRWLCQHRADWTPDCDRRRPWWLWIRAEKQLVGLGGGVGAAVHVGAMWACRVACGACVSFPFYSPVEMFGRWQRNSCCLSENNITLGRKVSVQVGVCWRKKPVSCQAINGSVKVPLSEYSWCHF